MAEDVTPKLAQELMPDALWQRVQPLLTPRPPRRYRYPGWLPHDDRAALAGIVHILITGCTWAQGPTDRIGCSGITYRSLLVAAHAQLTLQHGDLGVVLEKEGRDPGVEVVNFVLLDNGVGEGDMDDGLQVLYAIGSMSGRIHGYVGPSSCKRR